MMFRRFLPLALALPMIGCMEMAKPGMGLDDESMMSHAQRHWPTVRIDGLDGAHVSMLRGVFGDGLDVKAPFQADFQPTGEHVHSGYPLEIDLDETTSRRFGSEAPIRLRASLLVPMHMRRHGILRIDVTDCALRALVSGDLDVLKVQSEELPTADIACAPPKKIEEARKEAGCGCQQNQGVLSGLFGGMHNGMKSMRDRLGMGDRDKDAAVLEIAVMRTNDHPWR